MHQCELRRTMNVLFCHRRCPRPRSERSGRFDDGKISPNPIRTLLSQPAPDISAPAAV